MIRFLSPIWLLALLPVLFLAGVYVWRQLRRRAFAVKFTNVDLLRYLVPKGIGARRHAAAGVFLVALATLALGMARPSIDHKEPLERATIMLAIDVSLSMRVNDVKPTRLAAAQEAAKSFLHELPKHIEVGLVTFAGSSQVAQRATLDRDALYASIDGFQMQMGTAVGNAIVLCLAELFPDQGIELGDMSFSSKPQGRSLDDKVKPPPKPFTPVAPGSYDSAAIILLSDGRRTTGVDTLEAAKMAADRGVRIYVVGLGTVEGDASTPDGLAVYMRLDEPTLREVARMTGGEYHHAGTADALRSVYRNLGSRVQVLTRETELTGMLALGSALVAMAAAALSLLWFGRIA